MERDGSQSPLISPYEQQTGSWHKRLVLLLASMVFCLVIFVGLDAVFSAYILRSRPVTSAQDSCFISDPVRHHSLRVDCTCIRHWGKDSYSFATNSLGLRDENIRQVPLTSVQPRILLLGDSFTEGMGVWKDTYVGQIAASFPQYQFLNGGIESYAPSNYLNVAQKLIAQGVQFDEVIVFIDLSDAQDEAAFYRDAGPSGAVEGPTQIVHNSGWYASARLFITQHLLLTNRIAGMIERVAVRWGFYRLNVGHGQLFDLERSAWTYRPVSDSKPYEVGYAPLGLEGGLRKEEAKMTVLWEALNLRNIPISVVVYPWPAQIAHDSVDSRQVMMWRQWCDGKCGRFISVFPDFFAVKNSCPSGQTGCWYLQDFIFGDEHYSRAGNGLVAEAVGKSLQEQPPAKFDGPAHPRRLRDSVQYRVKSGRARRPS